MEISAQQDSIGQTVAASVGATVGAARFMTPQGQHLSFATPIKTMIEAEPNSH
jgi:hypothetical protein